MNWQPDAPAEIAVLRARMLAGIRHFFAERDVLEVDTPALSATGTTDPNIHSIQCASAYLQTSPEFFMKRLLAAGYPDIYQVCKVFRAGESGARHYPEFTMLEWYRREFSMQNLVDETCGLIDRLAVLPGTTESPIPRIQVQYRDAFRAATGLDPIGAGLDAIQTAAKDTLGAALDARLASALGEQRDAWLDLVMSHSVTPGFAGESLTVVTHYPASQAALARLDPDDPELAERFEIFYRGIELANGYRELTNAAEQRQRFARDNRQREMAGLPEVPVDEALIAALEHGLPECAGVAVGLDRLLMSLLAIDRLAGVISFRPYLTRDTYS